MSYVDLTGKRVNIDNVAVALARIMKVPLRVVVRTYGRDRRCTVPVKQSARR